MFHCLNEENKRFTNYLSLSLSLSLFILLLVRQLKHCGFLCNALNFLNEENENVSNYIFLSLYLIFLSSSIPLCLIALMKKTKGSQIISL
jgi:hypothetical protein